MDLPVKSCEECGKALVSAPTTRPSDWRIRRFCDHRCSTRAAAKRRHRENPHCRVDGCENSVYVRQLCSMHYHRWRKYGDPTRGGKARLIRSPGEPGHRYPTGDGYIEIYWPEHPMAGRRGRVAEHKLVMSEYLGRPLYVDERVHHINGVRDDNRIENLELWSTSHPSGQRVEDKLAWAYEMIERYAQGI